MSASVADLKQLSQLLDAGLDLDAPGREAWLTSLSADAARLAPTLRALLLKAATRETDDLLDRGPTIEIAAPPGGEAAAGRLVGPYRLLREIGSGGMGDVWLAERADGQLKRQVALKLPHLGWAPGLAERFAREREILSSLEHPHIARLYDAGLDAQGRPYMALEYVEGLAINDYCSKRQVGTPQRLALLLQVAEAVAFAHSRLVIHRDLKPGNILVTADGQVQLLDFGIAKLMEGQQAAETALTQAAGRALTLDYASPEQIRGEPIGTASDVYSLGVVAYELLSGAKPYKLKRASAAELEEAIAAQAVPLASSFAEAAPLKKQLQGDLDAILNRALKKDVAERYATVDALAQDIRRHLAGERVQARPDTLLYRINRLARQHRMPLTVGAIVATSFGLAIGVGATAVVIGALLLGLAAALWQARRAREQARVARVESRKADAVKRFLLDIFRANSHGQADALKAQQTTARELLDIGVRRVDEALRHEPESHIEVLDTLAELYFEVGLRTDAERLRGQGVKLARLTFGEGDLRFARAALNHARSAEGLAARVQIPGLLKEAEAALQSAGTADPVLRGTLFYELASYHRYDSLASALRTAEESARLLSQEGRRGGAADAYDPVEASNACRMTGRVRTIGGYYGLAEQHYRRALAISQASSNDGQALSVNAMGELAEALFKQGKVKEAEKFACKAYEISAQAHGATHRWTLVMGVRLANQLGDIGSDGEALALRRHIETALAQPRPEFDDQFRIDMAAQLGASLLDRGRPDLAEPPLRQDLDDLRAVLPNSGVLADREADMADLVLTFGRYEEATALLQSGHQRWLRYAGGAAAPGREALYALVGVRLALALGQTDEAHAWLSGFVFPETAELGRFYFRCIQLVAARAQLETRCGRPDRAMRIADMELTALQQQLGGAHLPHLEARLLRSRAEARQALGDHDGAAQDWATAVMLRRRHDDAASVWLAHDLVECGSFLADQGDMAQARGLADDAGRIFSQHPALGPHLLRPFEQLRQRLS